MKKILAVLFYLLLICLAFEFRLSELLDVRQLLLILAGTVVFYLITVGIKGSQKIKWNVVSRCALYTGLLQMFALLTLLFPKAGAEVSYLWLAGNCGRPMLYALCFWGVASILVERDSVERNLLQRDATKKESENPNLGTASDVGYRSLIEHGLTRREAEVAMLMCKGCSNKEIAAELTISETTVKKHISNIFEKTGIVRREEIFRLLQG